MTSVASCDDYVPADTAATARMRGGRFWARFRRHPLHSEPVERPSTRLEPPPSTRWIALKKFRYLMESLKPLAPGVSKRTLESLHALQTTMGDLHDLEVLSSSLAKHAEEESAERQAELAPVLAELEAKHSKMLQSFLKTADPILEYWDGVLAAAVPTAKAHRSS